MKYAILADIHANLTALESVMADIQSRGGVDEIWCLGDIVGYGPDPHECLDMVREYCSVCVAGNHDRAATGKMDTAYFNPEAAEAAHWTAGHLEEEDFRFLDNLPLIAEKGDFTLTHGSPRDPIREYILSARDAEANLGYFKTRYCLIGHSHIALMFECTASGRCDRRKITDESVITLGESRLIINPGGVGQPRDNDPRAGYAIYDREAGTLTLYRVEYNISLTQQKMIDAGLPAWLAHRLAYGR
jgi:predicted phosphodiesterase